MAKGLESLVKHSRVKIASDNTGPQRSSQEYEPQLPIQNFLVYGHEAPEVLHSHPLDRQMLVITCMHYFLYTPMHDREDKFCSVFSTHLYGSLHATPLICKTP